MKKMITTTLLAATLLTTAVQADVATVWEEMKEAATSMLQDTPAVQKEVVAETVQKNDETTAKTEENTKES
ncbi:MAG TPA: hypothetical protein PLH07_06410 [Sulfurovum sp.]|nr:MAG: hypothetical protein B7Y23_05440 [Sulfurovum sp. 16-42-52]OZA45407.1 MAG: hypothetical protein B7X80_05145 [Sulfurovum sp. 17-42-90]OZA61428.1 MAG: hypothetical protein B7X69_00490 [Sulfurovum sp. 39-42-12]HQR74707.1 hypothetical protein [Sulfurovum sp.]HQS73007.1 hypothetical protein [Sulfurovum sp.]